MAWEDWLVGDDSSGWSDFVPQQPQVSDSMDWSSLVPQAASYGFDTYAAPAASDYLQSGGEYGSDLVGSEYSPQARVQEFTVGPDQTTYEAYYSQPQQSLGGGIWNTMQDIGRAMETPGGKFGAGLFGAGISAYGANKANKGAKDAYKKQQEMLRARQAKSERFSEKANVGPLRQAVAAGAVQPRGGESVFFTNNRLPSYFAEGGGVSDEDYMRMQAEALQARQDAQMDRPSMMGFLRYIAAGKRMPSEIAAAKRSIQAQPRPAPIIDILQNRGRIIDEASGDAPVVIERACGGSTNYVQGGTSGQADKIDAKLSDGEYVMDADVVSALGDGNNEAGAKKLDTMRQQIRTHKRSAPSNKIPPKAKSPLAYMKKGVK